MATLSVSSVTRFEGRLRVPSDKSLTHRSFMFGAIAAGPCEVRRPLDGEDCLATLACLAAMGLRYEEIQNGYRLRPAAEWSAPEGELDCGNSGTTMRLLSGLIASRPISATLVGDASLSRRPMRRIAEPLRQMGATVEGETPPLRIAGGALRGIAYESPVASAQVKSATLLAGLRAEGVTRVTEPSLSRDHTERMLEALGVRLQRGVEAERPWVEVAPTPLLEPFSWTVPGDISSAAFWLAAAAARPGSQIVLDEVTVNPSRTGVLDVLAQCGVDVAIGEVNEDLNEPSATLEVRGPQILRPFTIAGDLVPRLIDEIPVLAVLATQAEGTSMVRDAVELRVKESDRIERVAHGLRAMGAEVETFADGMAITGPTRLRAATIDSAGDHRIGMAFAIAGTLADGETRIENADAIATSYPSFAEHLAHLTRG